MEILIIITFFPLKYSFINVSICRKLFHIQYTSIKQFITTAADTKNVVFFWCDPFESQR